MRKLSTIHCHIGDCIFYSSSEFVFLYKDISFFLNNSHVSWKSFLVSLVKLWILGSNCPLSVNTVPNLYMHQFHITNTKLIVDAVFLLTNMNSAFLQLIVNFFFFLSIPTVSRIPFRFLFEFAINNVSQLFVMVLNFSQSIINVGRF